MLRKNMPLYLTFFSKILFGIALICLPSISASQPQAESKTQTANQRLESKTISMAEHVASVLEHAGYSVEIAKDVIQTLIATGATEENIGNDDAIIAIAKQIQEQQEIDTFQPTKSTIEWKEWKAVGAAAFLGLTLLSFDRLAPSVQIGLGLTTTLLEIAAKRRLAQNKKSSTLFSLAANALSVINDMGFIKQNLLSDPYRYTDHNDTVDVAMHTFFLANDLAVCSETLDKVLAGKDGDIVDDQPETQDSTVNNWSQENETNIRQVIAISKTYLLPCCKGIATIAMACRQNFYGVKNKQLHSHKYNAERHIATSVYSLTRLIDIYQALKPQNTQKKCVIGTLMLVNAVWLALKIKERLDMNNRKKEVKVAEDGEVVVNARCYMCSLADDNNNKNGISCPQCKTVLCYDCINEQVNLAINVKDGLDPFNIKNLVHCQGQNCSHMLSPETMQGIINDHYEPTKNGAFMNAYRKALQKEKPNEPMAYIPGKEVKTCPQCSVYYERIDGCNHMTCDACYCTFCNVCAEKNCSNHGTWDGGEYFLHLNAYNPTAKTHGYWDRLPDNCAFNPIKRMVGFLGRIVIPIKNLALRQNHQIPDDAH